MRNNKHLHWAILLFATFSFGCKKFVTIPSPNNQLVTASTFGNVGSATSAQTYIYTQMLANYDSYFISVYNGLLADELECYSASSPLFEYYTNSLSASSSPGVWGDGYSYIFQSNAVMEGVAEFSSFSQAIKNQLIGEALFIRSFWLFELANMYGDIPLTLTTDYSANALMAKTSRDSVYRQVVSDLKLSENLLSVNYLDASDTLTTTDRVRPTKWAAMALLARVYLYDGNYSMARLEADSLIKNTALFSLPTVQNAFLANNSEAIWQIMVQQLATANATPDGQLFILTGVPSTGTYNATSLNANMVNSFESGDLRRKYWVNSYIATSGIPDTFYYPFKYKILQVGSPKEYETVLRLGEQYLIRAEAEAETGDLTDAINDLNIIRSRAGLTGTTSVSKQDILVSILKERRVEMFTEWGCRWYDLIRTNSVDSVMGAFAPQKGGSWDAHDKLYPLPQSELLLDSKLYQNVGY